MVQHYPDHLRPEDYRQRARSRAAHGRAGVGAAVMLESTDSRPGKRWSVVVSDGTSEHYIEVVAPGLDRWAGVPPSVVEDAVERRAAALSDGARLYDLATAGRIELSPDELRGA